MWTNFIRQKSRSYQSTMDEWLKMPIDEEEGLVRDEGGHIVTHADYVEFFIIYIESILRKNNYKIKDKNAFKKDIYKFIYTLSDNSKNEYKR